MLPIVQVPDCVPALKAIGEETRVRIVELLLNGRLDVGEIAEMMGGPMNTVSKHLRILRKAGLLIVTKRGRHRVYGLPEAIRKKGDRRGHVIDLGCCRFQFARRRPKRPEVASSKRAATHASRRTQAAPETIA